MPSFITIAWGQHRSFVPCVFPPAPNSIIDWLIHLRNILLDCWWWRRGTRKHFHPCMVYVFLVALVKLPGVTSLEHLPEGLQVVLYVVVPLLALRTWHYHRPSAWLLFGSGVFLLMIEAAIFSDVAESGQFARKLFYSLVIFHLPRLAPAVLLWWVGRRGFEESTEAEPLDVSDSGNARESC